MPVKGLIRREQHMAVADCGCCESHGLGGPPYGLRTCLWAQGVEPADSLTGLAITAKAAVGTQSNQPVPGRPDPG